LHSNGSEKGLKKEQKKMNNANTSTLDGARYILTVKNSNKLLTSGSLDAGTSVLCLRNDSGYYMPCVATVVAVTPSGRVTVDLYYDKSERVTVSKKAILWPTPEPCVNAHEALVNAAMGAYAMRDKFPCDCGPKVGEVCAWCGIKTELKRALELAGVKR
jgi:hypothetical protein